ncbi:hypothetical protein V8C26DRAFT_136588 [Trichoderma gracile]
MSSPPSGASPTSFDTQLPGSTAFLNASSTANRGPVISPLPSSSVISNDSVQGLLTSSKDVLDLTPDTTHILPSLIPSTSKAALSAEETVGISSTAVALDRSLTTSAEPALPTTTINGNQAGSSSPAQTPSSAEESSPRIVTLTTVSASKAPTATPSNQPSPSATVSSQSSVAVTKIAQETPSAPARPTSAIPSPATAVAAQPSDDSTSEPQIFSAESVDPPAEPSVLAADPATSSPIATSPLASTGSKDNSSTREQPPVAPTGPVNQRVSASAASTASTTSTSATFLSSIPTSLSIPTSAPGSAAILAAPSGATSTPVSATRVLLSDSILSGTSSSTATDESSTTPSFTGGIAAFPTFISTSSGGSSESSASAGSQPTGQPIEDPVGSKASPPTGTIVGGTVGGIAAAALILILLWLWKRRAADGGRGSSKESAFTEKGSPKSMVQRLGILTALNAVRRNVGEKLGSRNVNMDRGNSQFLEAAIAEPVIATLPPDPLCQHPVTPGNKREFRKGQGISLEPGKLNPFSDASSVMPGTVPPPSRSSILNPFSDDNMVLPRPVSASTRRSRGRSLGGLGNFQIPRGPPRPHSVHRESVHDLESMDQNRESFLERRDKFRSDPFDLELQTNQLFPPGIAVSTRASSVYSGQFQQNSHDSYTSRYVSGSSMGDWGGIKEGPVGSEGLVERVDSPTIT